jgi:hypothetical protein
VQEGKMVLPNGSIIRYINKEVDFRETIEDILPDFENVFCDLIQKGNEGDVKYEGPGLYFLDYWVNNQCYHGVTCQKLTNDDAEALKTEIEISEG